MALTPYLCDVSINQSPQPLSHSCRVPHRPGGAVSQPIHNLLVQQTLIQEVEQYPSIVINTIYSEDFPPGFQMMLGNNRQTEDLVIWNHASWEVIGYLPCGNPHSNSCNLK